MKTTKTALPQDTEQKPPEKKRKKVQTKTQKDKAPSKKKKGIEQIPDQWEEIITENPVKDAEAIKPDVEIAGGKSGVEPAPKKPEVKVFPKKQVGEDTSKKPGVNTTSEVLKEDEDLLFEKQPQFDLGNPKIWSGEKVESFHHHEKKTFYKKPNKQKFWNKNKPNYQNKNKPETSADGKSLVWREGGAATTDRTHQKPYGENKPKFFGKKNKSKFFGKKKSGTWEDRKPKFWSEGKPNTRLNQK